MIRTVLGGLIGGIALYIVGFLFWGTPLANLAFAHVPEAQSAELQRALAVNLTPTGTGTYLVPNPASQGGTVLFGQGPIATIHFNTAGFPVVDTAALIGELVLAVAAGLLLAFGLRMIRGQRERIEAALLLALGITLYLDLGQPLVNHYGWGYFIYMFLGDFLGFAAAGLVIAKWFGQPTVRVTGISPGAPRP